MFIPGDISRMDHDREGSKAMSFPRDFFEQKNPDVHPEIPAILVSFFHSEPGNFGIHVK